MKRVAVGSSDGKVINAHFGRSPKFYVFDIDELSILFVEERENKPGCSNLNEPQGSMEETIALIEDCDYVLVSQIGKPMIERCAEKGIIGMRHPDFIEDGLKHIQSIIE